MFHAKEKSLMIMLNYANTVFSKFILSWIGQSEPLQSAWRRQLLFYVYTICTTFNTPEDTSENWDNSNLDCWTPLDDRDDIRVNYIDLLCLYIRIIEPELAQQFDIRHSASIHYSDPAVFILEEPLRRQLMSSSKDAFMFENALLAMAFAMDTRVRRFCLTPTNALSALNCVIPDSHSTQTLITTIEDLFSQLFESSTYRNLLAIGSFVCQFIIYGQTQMPLSESALHYAPLVCFPQAHWII